MSFRDDGDAARARAAALSRELDERDAEIEALREQLEQRDAALREVKEEAALREVKEDASPILEAAERAQHALEALKRKKRESSKRAREELEEAPSDEEERERRRLSSVSVWGGLDLVSVAAIGVVPTLVATVPLAMRWSGFFIVIPACAGLALLALRSCGRAWTRRQWRLEEQWARARPYPLLGYLESLEKRPASISSLPFRLNDREHRLLELELDFGGGAIPSDLAEIMSGFDELLSTSSPIEESPIERIERRLRGKAIVAETKPNVFYRTSPITTTRSKSGISSVVDHNRAVRAFVRRLDHEVLEPLHARHALARVELRLR